MLLSKAEWLGRVRLVTVVPSEEIKENWQMGGREALAAVFP